MADLYEAWNVNGLVVGPSKTPPGDGTWRMWNRCGMPSKSWHRYLTATTTPRRFHRLAQALWIRWHAMPSYQPRLFYRGRQSSAICNSSYSIAKSRSRSSGTRLNPSCPSLTLPALLALHWSPTPPGQSHVGGPIRHLGPLGPLGPLSWTNRRVGRRAGPATSVLRRTHFPRLRHIDWRLPGFAGCRNRCLNALFLSQNVE